MGIQLTIPRRELQSACSHLKRMAAKARFKSELVLDLEAISLTLTLAGVRVTVPVVCPVEGRVIAAGGVLEALRLSARSRDAADMRLRLGETRLQVGETRYPCRWVAQRAQPILLPLNASLRDVLCLRYQYSEDETDGAGLAKTLASAEKKMGAMISRVKRTLEPLGVSQEALTQLVQDTLKEEANRHA